jgi:type I restriction enzyme, S subunit
MSEWSRARLAEVAEIRFSNVDKKTIPGEVPVRLCNYMDVYGNSGYITNDLPFMDASASTIEVDRFRVECGDVMLTKDSETPDDIGIPAVVVDEIQSLVCGYHLALIRPNHEQIDSVYLAKQLGSKATARYYSRLANGSTRYGLSSSSIGCTSIPLPPLPQQRRIAEILSSVDEAIEHTEGLIAKYQQIKAGLMHDLFTRGVTPDGHLRPTRAEAPHLYKESSLGWLPKEWEISQLREVTGKIADRDHTTPQYVDDGVLMVSPTNLMDDEGIDFLACRRIPLKDHLINLRKTDIQPGDLILHRIGAGLGAVRIVTDNMPEFSILHSMAVVRPLQSKVDPEFLLWAFRSSSVQSQMDIGTQSIGVPDLGLDKIGALVFPVAPKGEQVVIAQSLAANSNCIDAERRHCSKLKELKAGLMQDLLTGRVRVKVAEPMKGAV